MPGLPVSPTAPTKCTIVLNFFIHRNPITDKYLLDQEALLILDRPLILKIINSKLFLLGSKLLLIIKILYNADIVTLYKK